MKAISLWEPWATLMAMGLKRIETRSWETRYRGPLLICAAKKRDGHGRDLWNKLIVDRVIDGGDELGFGHALAVVELVQIVRTDFLVHAKSDEAKALRAEYLGGEIGPSLELRLGNYEPGRFAWLTRSVERVKGRVPVKGKQGLFEVRL